MARPIKEIAAEIVEDWGGKVNYAARPYLEAMCTIDAIDDMYGYDRADDIVRYFLGNSVTWRGQKAREIKAELRAMLPY